MPTMLASVGNVDGMERERGLAAADEEHALADTRAGRVGRHERATDVAAVARDGLDHQQRDAGQPCVLVRADDGADDAGQVHGRELAIRPS